ncbi:hypothetical protein V8G54_023641 [Vigna mungo]|uniref:Uncharacterized protein n=1 Tax=Vigna mungo TaxID=3915 RepID=A0AAQ3N3I3_VIGMU
MTSTPCFAAPPISAPSPLTSLLMTNRSTTMHDDDDIFYGVPSLKSAFKFSYDDVFAPAAFAFDDLLDGLGKLKPSEKEERGVADFDLLDPWIRERGDLKFFSFFFMTYLRFRTKSRHIKLLVQKGYLTHVRCRLRVNTIYIDDRLRVNMM